jgi:hypothetical protein
MSLSNIHFDLKELLKDALEKKEYKKVLKLMEKLVDSPSHSFSPNEFDGVLYKDVKNLLTSKENLENLLLSTKIIFENKDELLEFFQLLLDYGYKDVAISYFEEIMMNIADFEIIDGFNSILK